MHAKNHNEKILFSQRECIHGAAVNADCIWLR